MVRLYLSDIDAETQSGYNEVRSDLQALENHLLSADHTQTYRPWGVRVVYKFRDGETLPYPLVDAHKPGIATEVNLLYVPEGSRTPRSIERFRSAWVDGRTSAILELRDYLAQITDSVVLALISPQIVDNQSSVFLKLRTQGQERFNEVYNGLLEIPTFQQIVLANLSESPIVEKNHINDELSHLLFKERT